MDRDGSAKRVVRGVPWARFPSNGQRFLVVSRLSAVSPSRADSLARNKRILGTSDHPQERPSSATSPMRSSPDVVTDAARAKAKQPAHVPPCGGEIGREPPVHRACQEAPHQSRHRFVEASNRARPVGHRVGRRASQQCPPLQQHRRIWVQNCRGCRG